MPAVLPATRPTEADSRCNPWIFRSLQIQADAARGQPGAGHEPKLFHRKTLPKSSVATLAANPRPELMRGRQRPMRRERKDPVAVVAGIVDPGGSCIRFAANPRPELMRARRRPMRRQRKDAVAVVAGIVDPGWSRARFACRHHRCRLQQWRLDSTR